MTGSRVTGSSGAHRDGQLFQACLTNVQSAHFYVQYFNMVEKAVVKVSYLGVKFESSGNNLAPGRKNWLSFRRNSRDVFPKRRKTKETEEWNRILKFCFESQKKIPPKIENLPAEGNSEVLLYVLGACQLMTTL